MIRYTWCFSRYIIKIVLKISFLTAQCISLPPRQINDPLIFFLKAAAISQDSGATLIKTNLTFKKAQKSTTSVLIMQPLRPKSHSLINKLLHGIEVADYFFKLYVLVLQIDYSIIFWSLVHRANA